MTELVLIVVGLGAALILWPRLPAIRRYLTQRVLPRFGGDPRIRRLAFIAGYRFPDPVRERFAAQHPNLGPDAQTAVFEALREYFALCAADPDNVVGMPSRIAGEAWQSFIFCNSDYHAFCMRAVGRLLHHTPETATASSAQMSEAVRHAWRLACAREGIDSRQPSRLPALFAIDRRLGIEDGFYYALNEHDRSMAHRLLGASSAIYLAATMGGAAWGDAAVFGQAAAFHGHPQEWIGGMGGGDLGDVGGFEGGDFGGGGDMGGGGN